MPTPGEERRLCTPRRAANPRTCGRPHQELAGDQPDNWRAPTRRLAGRGVLVTRRLPASPPSRAPSGRVYVDSLGAVTIMAQKEPVTCGGSSSNPAGWSCSSSPSQPLACPSSWTLKWLCIRARFSNSMGEPATQKGACPPPPSWVNSPMVSS